MWTNVSLNHCTTAKTTTEPPSDWLCFLLSELKTRAHADPTRGCVWAESEQQSWSVFNDMRLSKQQTTGRTHCPTTPGSGLVWVRLVCGEVTHHTEYTSVARVTNQRHRDGDRARVLSQLTPTPKVQVDGWALLDLQKQLFRMDRGTAMEEQRPGYTMDYSISAWDYFIVIVRAFPHTHTHRCIAWTTPTWRIQGFLVNSKHYWEYIRKRLELIHNIVYLTFLSLLRYHYYILLPPFSRRNTSTVSSFSFSTLILCYDAKLNHRFPSLVQLKKGPAQEVSPHVTVCAQENTHIRTKLSLTLAHTHSCCV